MSSLKILQRSLTKDEVVGKANNMNDHRTSIRLYVESPLKENSSVELTPRQSHYLSNVMRQEVGQTILIFNGIDGGFIAKINSIHKRIVQLVIEKNIHPQTNKIPLSLLFSPLKGERLGFLIEKATELGVSDFYPVFTHRTVPSHINLERLEYRSIEAVEQCERYIIPKFHEGLTLEETLENWPSEALLFFCEERSKNPFLSDILKKTPEGHSFLIGPEGGFTEEEKILLKSKSFIRPVSLGKEVLRAETAALMALCLFSAHINQR